MELRLDTCSCIFVIFLYAEIFVGLNIWWGLLFGYSITSVCWERKFQDGPHTGCEHTTISYWTEWEVSSVANDNIKRRWPPWRWGIWSRTQSGWFLWICDVWQIVSYRGRVWTRWKTVSIVLCPICFKLSSQVISSYRAVYVSYGGLLMKLQGDANNFQGFTMDMNLYLLLKKLAF